MSSSSDTPIASMKPAVAAIFLPVIAAFFDTQSIANSKPTMAPITRISAPMERNSLLVSIVERIHTAATIRRIAIAMALIFSAWAFILMESPTLSKIPPKLSTTPWIALGMLRIAFLNLPMNAITPRTVLDTRKIAPPPRNKLQKDMVDFGLPSPPSAGPSPPIPNSLLTAFFIGSRTGLSAALKS